METCLENSDKHGAKLDPAATGSSGVPEIPPDLLLETIFPLGQQERGHGFTSPSAPPRTPPCSHCCAAQNNASARGGAALSNNEARRTFQKGDKLQSAPRREYGTFQWVL